MTMRDAQSTARAYIECVGAHDLDPLDGLLADDVVATFAGARSGKGEWIWALQRLLPVLVRNDIREIFTEADRVCVVYDFVTDTVAGSIRCVELLTIVAGTITEIELILDRVAFAPVNQELRERAAPTE